MSARILGNAYIESKQVVGTVRVANIGKGLGTTSQRITFPGAGKLSVGSRHALGVLMLQQAVPRNRARRGRELAGLYLPKVIVSIEVVQKCSGWTSLVDVDGMLFQSQLHHK
jgi:hypothetical protein